VDSFLQSPADIHGETSGLTVSIVSCSLVSTDNESAFNANACVLVFIAS